MTRTAFLHGLIGLHVRGLDIPQIVHHVGVYRAQGEHLDLSVDGR